MEKAPQPLLLSRRGYYLQKDRGVLKIVKRVGNGEETPMIGDKVYVHYKGKLSNGKKFDSSHDRNEPFVFSLGKSQVIKAWDIGVATMKKGEICHLLCKPEYAYGSAGSVPKIPSNATLFLRLSSLISKERTYLKMEALSGEPNGKERDIQIQTKEQQ